MNIATEIQDAINYIEEHLTDEIDSNQIAREACLSNFYFQRIFKVLFGYSIGEYIRFRRLTLAGNELAESDAKVVDVALKYGYETPESFSRAFKDFHGIAPSQVKGDYKKLKTFSRLSVIITLRGGSMDNYKIVKKEAFKVLEKVEKHTVDDEINKNTIPARTWVVFECVGAMPTAMQEAWHTISAEIIPSSSYKPTEEFDIEVYSAGDMNSPDYKSEVWIPIKSGK